MTGIYSSRRRLLALSGMTALSAISSASLARATLTTAKAFEQMLPAEENGYRAWLRYNKVDHKALLAAYRRHFTSVVVEGHSPTSNVVRNELSLGLSGLLDKAIPMATTVSAAGAVLVLTSKSTSLRYLVSEKTMQALGDEGFIIRATQLNGHAITLIAGNSDRGTLYGAFALLRHLATQQPIQDLAFEDKPKNSLRILAHSDNTYPAIDRGYSGNSLWHWQDLPECISKDSKVAKRLQDYGRINSSIGLNGVIINKVEADPAFLDSQNLPKVKALADIFRPYGLKIYVSANFASPKVLAGLKSDDPLAADVRNWWCQKVDEIYSLIPDFGGLEVKVNSEGMTGPEDYGRSHAQGANMMAAALAPYGGIVMWRAFVYDYPDKNINEDRVKRAYLEFHPLDGQFADNVLVQVKNGPLDFQPREPFHPLFGAMPRTRLLGELQLNQEYLGQATHLVYLGTMWQEFLTAKTDTSNTPASTLTNGASNCSVAEIIESGPRANCGGFTGTSNLGDDRNWTGHHFGQANWYAYGRLAWNPHLTASTLAREWIAMTWSNRPAVADIIYKIMMESHEAYVSYTMPLGLHHMVGGDHYAPMPEGYGDPRGMFHHASLEGIGYDRTRGGSDAVDQYHAPLSDQFNDVRSCPEKYLLWFHHLPWHHRMRSGRTLWQELCFKYDSGVKTAEQMRSLWQALASVIDRQRHAEVTAKLDQQVKDAGQWRDHCLNYFAQFSKQPII